jgi:hypothetical protein
MNMPFSKVAAITWLIGWYHLGQTTKDPANTTTLFSTRPGTSMRRLSTPIAGQSRCGSMPGPGSARPRKGGTKSTGILIPSNPLDIGFSRTIQSVHESLPADELALLRLGETPPNTPLAEISALKLRSGHLPASHSLAPRERAGARFTPRQFRGSPSDSLTTIMDTDSPIALKTSSTTGTHRRRQQPASLAPVTSITLSPPEREPRPGQPRG